MLFSNACKYGIRAVMVLVKNKEVMPVETIAKEINSPIPFTSKILQNLVRHQLISSIKGKKGGFFVDDKQASYITIGDIVHICEGKDVLNKCALGIENCSEQNPCPIHYIVSEIKEDLRRIYAIKITDVTQELLENKLFLK